MHQSLHDSKVLLLDANKALSQRCQDLEVVKEELLIVREENERSASFEEELINLRQEHNDLKKNYVSIHFCYCYLIDSKFNTSSLVHSLFYGNTGNL